MKKTLALLLMLLLMFTVAFTFTSCDDDDDNDIATIDDAYHEAYEIYVEHAKRNGLEYDEYEAWLASIKGEDGEDGEDGVTPQLRINEETNFWEVSYDNGTTWTSLDVKATGAQGDKGEQGEQGAQGNGISKVEFNDNGELIVYFTDGTSQNLGKILDEERCIHNYTEISVTEEDCEQKTALEFCTKCGIVRLKTYQKTNHGEWVDEVPATCTEDGVRGHYYCEVCDTYFDADHNKIDEDELEDKLLIPYQKTFHGELVNATPPTCTEDGHQACYVCYDCETIWDLDYNELDDDEIEDKILIEATGHTWADDDTCSVCGEPRTKEIITIWVYDVEGMRELTQTQIDRFLEENPEYARKYQFNIETVNNNQSASMVLADVASAPDIYWFNQDYTARLVQAGALAQLSTSATTTIKASNDATAVASASVGDTVWAYPIASNEGYFLYYDKSVISDPSTLEGIIADCIAAEAAGKTNYYFRFALENAWYTASFFFGAGCHSTWTIDEDGEFIAIDDDFNSDAGLIAMKGMHKLTSTSIYNSDSDRYDYTAAWVTGIWNANSAANYYGENLGVCKLPTFTVDGTTYQLGSFSGSKLMGVKPQRDSEKAAFLSELALYLTNEECQLERFENQWSMWVPTNLEAQKSDAVQSNPSAAALAAQNQYATPQGMIHGSWWDIAKVLGAESRNATTENDLKVALTDYEEAITKLLIPIDRNAWTVIGSIGGTSWGTDFSMTKINDNTWESDYMDLDEGDEFKIRQGYSWDVMYGGDVDGDGYADSGLSSPNYRVETAGIYKVLFTISDLGATITLVPA